MSARLEIILAFAATCFIPIHVSFVGFIFYFLYESDGVIHRERLVILLWFRFGVFVFSFMFTFLLAVIELKTI